VLVGIPAQIRRLALTDPTLRPKRVLLSADYSAPSLIATIERIWHCQALNHFGMTESGLGCAVETPERQGMVLRKDVLLETLPDGELVLTTLHREAMPLIRYRTGDLGKLLPNGNLGAVYGRKAALSAPITIGQLDDCLFAQDGVLDYAAEVKGNTLFVTVIGSREAAQEVLHGAFPGMEIHLVADDGVLSNGIAKRRLTITEEKA
jgi:phenylacetate-coenzyme A ligase PaaK-like adenylate-forming protein